MKSCFVISPIGEEGTETRKRSNQVLAHIIEPALTSCGYLAVRADQINDPGIITSQIINNIIESDLVVADLTEKNPNVFYELAIRHAIRKPVIQLIHKLEKIPFDVSGSRTIYFDHQDLDSVAFAKNKIAQQISAIELSGAAVDNPISIAVEVTALKTSADPIKNGMAEILDSINYLGREVNRLRNQGAEYGLFLPYVERLLIYYYQLVGELGFGNHEFYPSRSGERQQYSIEQLAALHPHLTGIQNTLERFCIERGFPKIAPPRL